jgi:hypothetical protein
LAVNADRWEVNILGEALQFSNLPRDGHVLIRLRLRQLNLILAHSRSQAVSPILQLPQALPLALVLRSKHFLSPVVSRSRLAELCDDVTNQQLLIS